MVPYPFLYPHRDASAADAHCDVNGDPSAYGDADTTDCNASRYWP
jgi:hypothetical protein